MMVHKCGGDIAEAARNRYNATGLPAGGGAMMTEDQEKRLENVERLVRVDGALATQLSQSIQRNSRLDNELTKANAEVERLREAIRKVHRVYWSGPDVDMRAVSVACLTLFANTLGADGPSTLPLSPETNRQIEEMRESRREQREKDE